jgi:hypothetical protein
MHYQETSSWAWMALPVILTLERLRQEDLKFEIILDYIDTKKETS